MCDERLNGELFVIDEYAAMVDAGTLETLSFTTETRVAKSLSYSRYRSLRLSAGSTMVTTWVDRH